MNGPLCVAAGSKSILNDFRKLVRAVKSQLYANKDATGDKIVKNEMAYANNLDQQPAEQQSSRSSAVNAPSTPGINNTSGMQLPENDHVRQSRNGRHSRNVHVQRESPTERSPRDVNPDVDAYEMGNSAYETLNADDVQRRNSNGDRSQYDNLQL